MAAEKHRKSNFFASQRRPELPEVQLVSQSCGEARCGKAEPRLHSSETSGALFVLLAFMEVRRASKILLPMTLQGVSTHGSRFEQ